MTEPQDVLAEALAAFRCNPGHQSKRDGACGACLMLAGQWLITNAALVRTPETLDVDRLRRAMLNVDEADPGIFNIVAISDPDTRPVAAALAAEYARLAASPAPDPGAGLREALHAAVRAIPNDYPDVVARSDVGMAIDDVLAPSAEPPETA